MRALHIRGGAHVSYHKKRAHEQERTLYVSNDPTCRLGVRHYQVGQLARFVWYTYLKDELVMRGGKLRPVRVRHVRPCRIVSHDRAYLWGGIVHSLYTVKYDGKFRKWVDTGKLRRASLADLARSL